MSSQPKKPESRRKEKPARLFENLNHRSKKIFYEEYNFDRFKFEVRRKSSFDVEFASVGVYTPDSDKLRGTFGIKYQPKDFGLCFSKKYNTDDVLTTETQLTPQNYFKGAKINVESKIILGESRIIPSNLPSLRIKAVYRRPVMSANVDFETPTPRITLAGIIQHYGWFIGSQFKYDLKNSKLKNHNVAVGYTTKNFMLHTNVSDGKVFNGSVSQKINNFLETGFELGWSMENKTTKIGIGCIYALNRNTSIRAKVNHSSEIGVAYSQRFTNGITITLSALINGKNSHLNMHKVGMGIIFER